MQVCPEGLDGKQGTAREKSQHRRFPAIALPRAVGSAREHSLPVAAAAVIPAVSIAIPLDIPAWEAGITPGGCPGIIEHRPLVSHPRWTKTVVDRIRPFVRTYALRRTCWSNSGPGVRPLIAWRSAAVLTP